MYTKHKWNSDKHFNFGYVMNLPKDFDATKKYPIVFFLHGVGECGEDLDHAMIHGYMKHVREEDKDYPFIFIAPQCPVGKYWAALTESLIAFVDEMTETLPVDQDRVYLTGLSMGGYGTWMLAQAYPEKWAAIAPICGGGLVWFAEAIKDLPIMTYHGDCDTTVPISESTNMLTAVNGKGGNAQIKVCYGVGHNCWDIAYEGDDLWNWMSSHIRKHPEAALERES